MSEVYDLRPPVSTVVPFLPVVVDPGDSLTVGVPTLRLGSPE